MNQTKVKFTVLTTRQDKKLDILVSNAAVNPAFGPMLDTPDWAWDKIFEVNVKNAFQLIQETAPYLEETKGNITCISSIAGFQPMNLIGVYSGNFAKIFENSKIFRSRRILYSRSITGFR